jgi:uncharacterized protein (TIGR02757 family)
MKKAGPENKRLALQLEALYERFNRPEWIDPDPLAVAREYRTRADREVAALVAAALAFGGVRQIMASVRRALAPFPRPHADLLAARPEEIHRACASFRHRYADGEELAALLTGVRGVLEEHRSLGALFATLGTPGEEDVVPALTRFVRVLAAGSRLSRNYLLPDPARGSACKRLLLYLRWMTRSDAVDMGLWKGVDPAMLVVPLDIHMHRICTRLGFTRRRTADLRAAREVTAAFRALRPDDPVRYDFCLTRAAMHEPRALEALFGGVTPPPGL